MRSITKRTGKFLGCIIASWVLLIRAFTMVSAIDSFTVAGLALDDTNKGGVTWTYGADSITATATSVKDRCDDVTNPVDSGSLKISNDLGETRTLLFDYKVTKTGNGGTVTITLPDNSTQTLTESSQFSTELSAGKGITVTVTGNEAAKNSTASVKLEITEVKLLSNEPNIVTLGDAVNGSYSVTYNGNNFTPADTETIEVTPGGSITISAAANSGYVFDLWHNVSGKKPLTAQSSYTFVVSENMTIAPGFVKNPGTAPFKVGSTGYYTWESACLAAENGGTIVLVGDYSFPDTYAGNGMTGPGAYVTGNDGNLVYTLNSGKNLLLPYGNGSSDVSKYNKDTKAPYALADWNTSVYLASYAENVSRTLTLPGSSTLEINGVVAVGGVLGSNNGVAGGTVYRDKSGNQYYHANIQADGDIVVKNGGKLSSCGYIYGDGTVTAESGAEVYEPFVVMDYNGGYYTVFASAKASNSSYSGYGHSPYSGETAISAFTMWTMPNIQTELRINYGGKLVGYADLYASDAHNKTTVNLIDSASGLIALSGSDGYIVCRYDETTTVPTRNGTFDEARSKIGKTTVAVYGGGAMGGITLSVQLSVLSGSIPTTAMTFPLGYNIDVELHNGTYNMAYDLAVQSGATLKVETDATLNINSGGSLTVYKSIYDQKSSKTSIAETATTYSNLYGYPTVTDLRSASFDGTGSGDFIVNGTLNINSGGAFGGVVQTDGVAGEIHVKSGAVTTTTTQIGVNGVIDLPLMDPVDYCAASVYKHVGQIYNPHEDAIVDLAVGDYHATKGNTTIDDCTYTLYYSSADTSLSSPRSIKAIKGDLNIQINGGFYNHKVTYNENGVVTGYDYIVGDTVKIDLSNYNGVPTVTADTDVAITNDGEFITVSGINSDVVLTITATPKVFNVRFLLNEKYGPMYTRFTGSQLPATTVTVDGLNYYVLYSADAAYGTEVTGYPAEATMLDGTTDLYNFDWKLTDSSLGYDFTDILASSADADGNVNIFGVYTGYIAYNSSTKQYYTTLGRALASVPLEGSTTVRLLGDTGILMPEQDGGISSIGSQATVILELGGYTGQASILNSGDLTVQNGTLFADTVGTSTAYNSVYVIRNAASGTLRLDGVTLDQRGAVSAKDRRAALVNHGGTVEYIRDCVLMNGSATGITSGVFGYAIYNYGGTIEEISDSALYGYYGIYNRNIRASGADIGQVYQVTDTATIELIEDTDITAYQYCLYNGGIVKKITGDSVLLANYRYAIYNANLWYHDKNQLTSVTGDDGTVTVTYDHSNVPTIEEISGTTQVWAKNSYALTNGGLVKKITGNVVIKADSDGVVTSKANKNYGLHNIESGVVEEISGSVLITASKYPIFNSGPRAQKTVTTKDAAGRNASVTTVYGEPATIKLITGNVIVQAGAAEGAYNYGKINAITGNVTIKGSTNTLLNHATGHLKHKVVTYHWADDTTTTIYYTETISDYGRAYIGTIGGSGSTVKITSSATGALTNNGIVDLVGEGVTMSAKAATLQIGSGVHTSQSAVYQGYSDTEGYTIAATTLGQKQDKAEVGSISGASISATDTDTNAILNHGHIGSVTNTLLSSKGHTIYNDHHTQITKTVTQDEISSYFTLTDDGKGYAQGQTAPGTTTETVIAAVIGELGIGVQATSSANYAVYNAATGEITKISGGIYTASAAQKYAIYNESTASAIYMIGGNFKGDASNMSREFAVYDADNKDSYIYHEGYALTPQGTYRSVMMADQTEGKYYYYIAPGKTIAGTVTGGISSGTEPSEVYGTLEEAIKAYEKLVKAGKKDVYVVLLTTPESEEKESVTLTQDLYLDINGFTLNADFNLNGHTLYGMDSATNSYLQPTDTVPDPTPGSITGAFSGGTVSAAHKVDRGAYINKHYVTITANDGSTQFHRVSVSVTGIQFALDMADTDDVRDDIGYLSFRGTFRGDSEAAKKLTDMGFEIDGVKSWYGSPNEGEESSEVDFTPADGLHVYYTRRLSSISDIQIASALMELGDGNEYEGLEQDVYALLRQIKTQIEASEKLTAAQKAAMIAYFQNLPAAPSTT